MENDENPEPQNQFMSSSDAESTYTNSLTVEFVFIKSFVSLMMSSDTNIENAGNDETPRHRVTIGQPFYLVQ
jgi:formylglycine-generating enzyme required for sulfatase activity